MTELDLDPIRRRAAAATAGPWTTGDQFGSGALGPAVVVLAGNLQPLELDPNRNGLANAQFIANARVDVPALLAEIDRLTRRRASDERAALDTIRDRDHAESMADQLADVIARITGVEIGEHSNINCPWENALQAGTEHADQGSHRR